MIVLDLLLRPLRDEAFQAFLTEGALNCLEHADRELSMVVREVFGRFGGELPHTRGAPHLVSHVDEADQTLPLQYGEVLTHGHRRDAQLLGHLRRNLGTRRLQNEEDAVTT
jgi:hypothetical protein